MRLKGGKIRFVFFFPGLILSSPLGGGLPFSKEKEYKKSHVFLTIQRYGMLFFELLWGRLAFVYLNLWGLSINTSCLEVTFFGWVSWPSGKFPVIPHCEYTFYWAKYWALLLAEVVCSNKLEKEAGIKINGFYYIPFF